MELRFNRKVRSEGQLIEFSNETKKNKPELDHYTEKLCDEFSEYSGQEMSEEDFSEKFNAFEEKYFSTMGKNIFILINKRYPVYVRYLHAIWVLE
jgi:hypothetical protein